jgi:hypothetical protein
MNETLPKTRFSLESPDIRRLRGPSAPETAKQADGPLAFRVSGIVATPNLW